MQEMPRVVRVLYLPRDPVFDAWTQSEHLAQWFPPEDCRVEEAVVEPEVGGRFEIAWRDGAGRLVREVGRFTEFAPPERFACAMQDSPGAGAARLFLELEDQVDTCRLVLREEPAADGSVAQGTRRREWEDRLDRLEAYFSAI